MKNEKNTLTDTEKKMLENIENGGIENIEKHHLIWCYLDGKRNGCKTFDERINQLVIK